MALIAKETLKLGHTVVALPGTQVSKELVDAQGWHDLVDDEDGAAGKGKRSTRKATAE